MNYDWYLIFNKAEFEATGLVQRSILLLLEARGRVEFLITQGNTLGVTYLDEFLPVQFYGDNPFAKNGYAVYLDADDGVWFGFEVEVEE